MAQVLWAPQDGLKLPELATTVAGAIRASLGAQMSDARQDAVEKRIDEAYHAVYTPKGKLKGGKDAPAVVGMEAELKEVQRQRLSLEEQVAAFETAGRRIEDLRGRRDRAKRDEDQLAKDLAAAAARAKAYAEVRARRDHQKEVANAAEARTPRRNAWWTKFSRSGPSCAKPSAIQPSRRRDALARRRSSSLLKRPIAPERNSMRFAGGGKRSIPPNKRPSTRPDSSRTAENWPRPND